MLWVYGVSLVVVLSTLAFLSIVAYRRFLRRERMMAEALARQRGSEDNTVIIQFCGALDRCAVSEDDVRQVSEWSCLNTFLSVFLEGSDAY
mmetsp:Transcript_10767/g.44869  ORF Transcript_10767/g.44869 Transcript_10767/m.44869 type:complete len:91 (+) Transcript_10767:181-453(+)